VTDSLEVEFDPQIFERQSVGGISRHFADLISALDSNQGLGVECRISMRSTTNAYLRRPGGGRIVSLPNRPGMARLSNLINATVRTGLPDVVHHTFYAERYLERWQGATRVSTVHDMIPEAMPELFPEGNPHAGKDAYLQASDLIIAVSETTRDELHRLRPGLETPVIVIHEAADAIFSPGVSLVPDSNPALLYVGGRTGYKQFPVLLQAIARLRRSGMHVPLLCVGGPFTTAEAQLISRLDLAGVVRQASVSDRELAASYRQATALVATAAAEGFGLPVVEAMQSGCPVILPRASVFPETAGEAAMYYESGDPLSLAETIARLLTSPELRTETARLGLERATAYSWRRTAELTAAAYRSVAGGRAGHSGAAQGVCPP
jgi:glycosyltransferase involved in cell wall biosynthesis